MVASNAQSTKPVTLNSSVAPIVDLGYAKFLGYTNATAGINYFRGIPYAADPSGAQRWRKPHPIEMTNVYDSNTVYNATEIAPACYQTSIYELYAELTKTIQVYGAAGFSENCLVLDVYVPSRPVSQRLPVVVQIHGGAYVEGNAQSNPGDAMVNASNGSLIYVSIQYRLGIFGFLSGAELAADGILNAGLLDQRAALDWVQRNIHAFGGDPSKVTIWGGSAGGGSVTAQLIAGGAYDEPPFSAAIAEYPWWQPFLNQSEQEIQFNTALKKSGCSTVTCLRNLPVESLATLSQAVDNSTYGGNGNGYGSAYFGPVVDGTFIRELPSIAFNTGHFYDVPLIVDHDAYEGVFFSNVSETSQTEETLGAEALFSSAGPAFFSRLYDLYPASDFNSTFFQRQTWFGDFIINCPTYYMASNAVDRNTNRSAIFKLTFAAGSQLHGATVPFLVSSVTGDWPNANNQTLAEIMTSYWISFIVTHDPNVLKLSNAPYWPSYASGGNGTVANGESVGFDTLAITYTTIGPAKDPDASARCDFFNSKGFVVQN